MGLSSRNKMSRRRFLKLSSGGLAAGGFLYLTGCQPSPTPAASQAAATVPPAATFPPAATIPPPTATKPAPAATATKVVKTLRFALSEAQGPKETTDPAFGISFPDAARISAIYDQLVELDDSFKPKPMLAESWEFNDKADVWTFKLRQDVKFHDGSKLTAKDVVYSFQRILDPKTASPGAGEMAGIDPAGIKAVDDYTVRFSLPQPMVDLLLTINNRFTWIVKEGATSSDLKSKGMGTGPFKLDKFTPGEDPTVVVRNKDYWKQGVPQVDTIEFRSIVEPSARSAALQRGQVDIIEDVPMAEIKNLQGSKGIEVISERSGAWDAFVMMVDKPPFNNNKVRLALKYCMDRPKIMDLVLQGHGQVANDVPVPPWVEYALQDPPRGRDIAKAKSLLAEAGYSKGLDLELYISNTRPWWIDLATVFQQLAAEAGINITLKNSSADTYWSEVWMKKPFCMTGWSARAADAMLSVAFMSKAEWNETHWYRSDWDALIFKARQTVDKAQRTTIYQQAQKMIVDEGGVLIPYFSDSLAGKRVAVTGWKPGARHIVYDFTTVDIKG